MTVPIEVIGYDNYISTHTLTWSVTILAKTHINHANISTHTLTWSVTQYKYLYTYINTHFNSHAHVERDQPYFKITQKNQNFNSHAHVERD